MEQVMILGGGKIGVLAAVLLAMTQDYSVHIGDLKHQLADMHGVSEEASKIKYLLIDMQDPDAHAVLAEYVQQNAITTLISALPYFCQPFVAQFAKDKGLHYFDLTEDTVVTDKIQSLAKNAKTIFMPQCGLAPGFISIVAHDLMQGFDSIDTVLMRVGALPEYPNNALKYSLTWSTDGLINEYGNPCYAIVQGKETILQPLEGLETIQIDGLLYEAFNTSGGLGSLAKTYKDKINTMNYKTLRYPGHCHKMRLLMNDLKLNQDRGTLKRILENALSKTYQDVVIIYVAVKGYKNNELIENTYVKKIYPRVIAGKLWSSIQVTTAASLCAVLDIVLHNKNQHHGLVMQEEISLDQFLNNRFGKMY